jgi:hypothetical protein
MTGTAFPGILIHQWTPSQGAAAAEAWAYYSPDFCFRLSRCVAKGHKVAVASSTILLYQPADAAAHTSFICNRYTEMPQLGQTIVMVVDAYLGLHLKWAKIWSDVSVILLDFSPCFHKRAVTKAFSKMTTHHIIFSTQPDPIKSTNQTRDRTKINHSKLPVAGPKEFVMRLLLHDQC